MEKLSIGLAVVLIAGAAAFFIPTRQSAEAAPVQPPKQDASAEKAAKQPMEALLPWAAKATSADIDRRHAEEITKGEYKYIVIHGGTMDGANCRTPMGCGMSREGAI